MSIFQAEGHFYCSDQTVKMGDLYLVILHDNQYSEYNYNGSQVYL